MPLLWNSVRRPLLADFGFLGFLMLPAAFRFCLVALASTFVLLLLDVCHLIIGLSGPVIVVAASALWHSRVLYLLL